MITEKAIKILHPVKIQKKPVKKENLYLMENGKGRSAVYIIKNNM